MHLGAALTAVHHHRDLAGAVAARVFQQVAQGPAQQLGHTAHLQRIGARAHVQVGVHAGAFLGGQANQVHQLHGAHIGLARIEAAGQQDLVHQLVQLCDVAQDLGAECGRGLLATHQLQPHADAGERRAQLVRGIGQQRLVRLDQVFHPLGGGVELARQVGHLVLPLLGHPHREVALAKLLHAALQGFEPLREAADDGVHPHRHCQAHDAQEPQETKRRARPERGPALVGPAALPPACPFAARLAGRHLQGEGLAGVGFDAEFHALPGFGGLARGHAAQQQFARGVAQRHLARRGHKRLVGLCLLLLRHAPGPAHGEGQHRNAADHSQPDAQVQAAGEGGGQGHPASPAVWQRHNRRRAP